MGDFKTLRAWQEARTLARLSKVAIEKLPSDERFALAQQWKRAVYSVALNIAEGSSRRGPKEFRRFLDVALGSLHEVEAILELVAALEYLPRQELTPLISTRANCARLVFALMRRMGDAAAKEK
jgi:four helix bundle protein